MNNSTRSLLAVESGFAVYDYGRGKRLTTQYLILVSNKAVFFLQIVTPTSEIYPEVNNVLSIQRVKMFSLLAAASTIAFFVVLLRKWNIILKKEVKRRTQELEDSYDEMKRYLDEVLKITKGKQQ